MNDKSELLGSLKIDREQPPADGRWRYVLGAVFVVFAIIVAGALLWPAARPAVKVALVQAAAGGASASAASILDASGYVVARRQATVSSRVTGQVTEVMVEEGLLVAEGQVLARVDDSSARAQFELARSRMRSAQAAVTELQVQLDEARRQLRRAHELAAKGVLAQADLDAASAQVDVLEARLARSGHDLGVARDAVAVQQVVLDDHVIRAPFAGVVTVKAAQPGEMISPVSAGGGFTRTGVATIVDMDSLEIEVDVNENFINRVSAGQPVTATLNAYADWKIPAQVIAVVPAADRSKATVRVRIGFALSDPRILPDMGVRVSFLEAGKADDSEPAASRLMIPGEALYDDAGTSVVYVLRGDRLERRAVRVAGKRGERLEVSAGLNASERVVIGDSALLADGLRVRIIEGSK